MDYTVEYYEKDDGSRPAEEFIFSQDNKMQAKIFAALELLESKGPALREPYSKVFDDGIFEVRAKQGSDISRVLYCSSSRTQSDPHQWLCKKIDENTAARD